MNQNKNVIFIIGPTAVGKSAIAHRFAKEVDGEIISCDSMQVYQEITIASNKEREVYQNTISYYLVDCVSVYESFDVAQYNRLAREAIEKIHSKGKTPLIVGGSGMYIKVLLDGLYEGLEPDPRLREELEQKAQKEGAEALHQMLKEKDPVAAEEIHPSNVKRVIRALEICFSSGKTLVEAKEKREGLWGNYPVYVFGLQKDRAKLYERINQRVDEMIEEGLIDEIQSLDSERLSLTAQYLIGVKEVREYLDGHVNLERARELMKQNTRHLAKRQLTWFRKEARIDWINLDQESDLDQICAYMKGKINELA